MIAVLLSIITVIYVAWPLFDKAPAMAKAPVKAKTPVKAKAAPVTLVNFCGQCGAKLKPGDKFCSQCGNKID